MKFVTPLFVFVTLLLAAGCKPRSKEISTLNRKEAASLASEAQFANTLRDYARAEPLYEKAAKLCPDTGEYWINLGVVRRRLDNKSGAKEAYENARSVYHEISARSAKRTDALLQEVYALALLGRADEARKTLEKARKQLPDDRGLRTFVESHQLDHILEDPTFKEIAL